MSSLMEVLAEQLGKGLIDKIGGEIGEDKNKTQDAISVALPAILGGIFKNLRTEKSAEDLHKAVEKDHSGGLFDNLPGLPKVAEDHGAGILEHILGGKRQQVEEGVAKSSGIQTEIASKLLKLLAPIVLNAIGKMLKDMKMNPGDLFDFIGKERQQVEEKAPQQVGLIEQMLDTDGDGDLDFNDLLKHGQKILGGYMKSGA